MRTLGELLEEALARREMTHEQFATAIGYSDGQPSNFIHGRRKIAKSKIPIACTALGLAIGTTERRDFEVAAYLCHAPAEVVTLIESLEAQVLQLKKQAVELQAKVISLGGK